MLFFMFFQKLFPESILGGKNRQATLKNGISEPSLVSSGVQHVTLGAPFSANRLPKARSFELPFASWADLGATCDLKPSKDTSS